MRPVLFVTGHAPFDRVGAFARLHECEEVELALFGGRSQHGGSSDEGKCPDRTLPFPHRHVRQRALARLAASGRYRAVVVPTGGRVALPAAWAGARRAGVPVILWASLWAHPRTVAHAFSYPALARLYRSADAVVTYGPHVSAYVRARGARNVHIARQSVDNEFWARVPSVAEVDSATAPPWPSRAAVKFLFAGRPVREKGVGVLLDAWSLSGLVAPSAALVLAGVGSSPPWIPAGGAARGSTTRRGRRILAAAGRLVGRAAGPGACEAGTDEVLCLDPLRPPQLRSVYAAADVLVVPSIATRTFREPWGLVINEAMNRNLPVIVSDAVGAAAGGLVRDGRNGLVVPAGDPYALAAALRRLAADAPLRARLGAAGAADVRAYTHDAWAEGFSHALHSLGLSYAAGAPARAGYSGDGGLSRGGRW
jgi:glycosyltransferase involved in cell wall biosynthesis